MDERRPHSGFRRTHARPHLALSTNTLMERPNELENGAEEMSLATGSKLGPYEIVAPLGAGGMGEVYHARDTRLGREVAIKVLPESFSKDPDRLRRFEQEARAASQLNHPNIVTVHDFGTHGGAPYVVQELLEGETLRERLRAGALPARKAVDYGIQVARGLTVDQRADIFALGAILYEMLSGASAFKRGSSADTMSAILKEDPPELPSDSKVPPALDRIVRRCLEKQPNQRFQDASDVAFALEALSGTASHLVDAAVQTRPSSRWAQWRLWPAWLAGAVAGAAVLLALVLLSRH